MRALSLLAIALFLTACAETEISPVYSHMLDVHKVVYYNVEGISYTEIYWMNNGEEYNRELTGHYKIVPPAKVAVYEWFRKIEQINNYTTLE